MAKHAVSPHIAVSDSEKLIQASHILKACIGAHGSSDPIALEINPSFTLEVVRGLVQDVIEHREARWRKRPGEPRSWITERLQQATSILKLCIVANDTDPQFTREFSFSPPMRVLVEMIDEAWNRLSVENDQRSRARPSKARFKELQFLRGAAAPDSTEGKPN